MLAPFSRCLSTLERVQLNATQKTYAIYLLSPAVISYHPKITTNVLLGKSNCLSGVSNAMCCYTFIDHYHRYVEANYKIYQHLHLLVPMFPTNMGWNS